MIITLMYKLSMRCYHHFLQKMGEEKNKNFKSEGPEPHPICWLLSD